MDGRSSKTSQGIVSCSELYLSLELWTDIGSQTSVIATPWMSLSCSLRRSILGSTPIQLCSSSSSRKAALYEPSQAMGFLIPIFLENHHLCYPPVRESASEAVAALLFLNMPNLPRRPRINLLGRSLLSLRAQESLYPFDMCCVPPSGSPSHRFVISIGRELPV